MNDARNLTIREAVAAHALELAESLWPARPPEADLASADDAPWFVIETEPQQETLAAAHVIGRRLGTYLPALAVFARRGRAYQWRTQPMFPGYLFVKVALCDAERGMARIRSLPGVRPFIHTAGSTGSSGAGGRSYAVIGEADMRRIREVERRSFERKLAAQRKQHLPYDGALATGTRVRVTDDLFGGSEGPIEEIASMDRIKVLLDIMGRSTPVWVPAAYLEAVDSTAPANRRKN